MGDRGNVIFTTNEGSFGYYSHWNGSRLPELVAEILSENPSVAGRLDVDLEYGYRGVVHGLLLKEFPQGVEETGAGLYPGRVLPDGTLELEFNADGSIWCQEADYTVAQFIDRYHPNNKSARIAELQATIEQAQAELKALGA